MHASSRDRVLQPRSEDLFLSHVCKSAFLTHYYFFFNNSIEMGNDHTTTIRILHFVAQNASL